MLNRLKLSGARSLLALLGLVGWLLCSASAVQSAPPPAAGTVVQTPQVRAQLLVFAPDGVSVGKTLWLGLQMQHQKLWHTYWRNPGDSGLATQLDWSLPAGLEVGDLAWPAPQKIPLGPLTNYGYEGRLLLAVPVRVGPAFQAGSGAVDVRLHANWLVCRQECIPQEGDFAFKLPVKSSTVMQADAFGSVIQHQAQALPGAHSAEISKDGKWLTLQLAGLPESLQRSAWTVLPQTPNVVQNSLAPEVQTVSGLAADARQIRFAISSDRMDSPKQMTWLLVQGDALAPSGPQWSWITPVKGQWQELAPALSTSSGAALQTSQALKPALAPALVAAPMGAWLLTLMGAFLGGLVLNLMPCVFPVLAIKVMGLAQHSSNPRYLKASGFAFGLGVVASFLLLGGLMLGLRAAGSQLGWGFQLQSPAVVGVLAILFAVMALNLSGLFEFGQFVPSQVASLQIQNPVWNSLWSGVLAVVIASPCTAPFMGASLGMAIGLPTWQALPIFAVMGVGMALPMAAASWAPGLIRFMPRPGLWMQVFRQFMAFPLYATVIWLTWVLGQQVGLEGVTPFLACLLSIAFLLWALGLPGRMGRSLQGLAVLSLAALLWQWGPSWLSVPEQPAAQEPSAAALQGKAPAGVWQPWSAQALATARQEGRGVFVDFTAAWCVTCQFNKKVTFSDPALLADFAQRNVLLLRADWTRYDPAITAALNALGRSGLPVYAWYAPGKDAQLLSEMPSAGDVQAALAKATAKP